MTIEGRSDANLGGRIRLGMVGGGEGAFIGAVHRIAARIDDQYELVAGALSSTPEKARRSGQGLTHSLFSEIALPPWSAVANDCAQARFLEFVAAHAR
jgi:hypothetical protein